MIRNVQEFFILHQFSHLSLIAHYSDVLALKNPSHRLLEKSNFIYTTNGYIDELLQRVEAAWKDIAEVLSPNH